MKQWGSMDERLVSKFMITAHRTSNMAESFFRGMNAQFPSAHPSLDSLLFHTQSRESRTWIELTAIRSDPSFRYTNPRSTNRNDDLCEEMSNFHYITQCTKPSTDDILSYLDAMHKFVHNKHNWLLMLVVSFWCQLFLSSFAVSYSVVEWYMLSIGCYGHKLSFHLMGKRKKLQIFWLKYSDNLTRPLKAQVGYSDELNRILCTRKRIFCLLPTDILPLFPDIRPSA